MKPYTNSAAKKIKTNDPTKTGRVIEERRCQRCGNEWFPRVAAEPPMCPQCKSIHWKTPKKAE